MTKPKPEVRAAREARAALITELHDKGYSAAKIARLLNESGVSTPRRGARGWQATTVLRILERGYN